jgi:hypothetical protein
MSLREAIKWSLSKRESQLKSDQTAPEKVSVLAHGRGAVLGIRMSIHTIQRKRDFGSTEHQPPVYGNIVNTGTLLTAPTEGGLQ